MHRFFSSSLATPSQAVLYFDLSLLKLDLHVSFICMSSIRLRLAGEVTSWGRSFRSYGLRKFFGVGSGEWACCYGERSHDGGKENGELHCYGLGFDGGRFGGMVGGWRWKRKKGD
jgi:hypothetical protein